MEQNFEEGVRAPGWYLVGGGEALAAEGTACAQALRQTGCAGRVGGMGRSPVWLEQSERGWEREAGRAEGAGRAVWYSG